MGVISDLMTAIVEKVHSIANSKVNLRDSIVEKGVPVPEDTLLEGMHNYVRQIQTAPTGIDTDDATATANDIIDGMTAYVKGEKVTGVIQKKPLEVVPSTVGQTFFGNGGVVYDPVSVSQIPPKYKDTMDATLTAEKMLSGETAYSKGEKLTGTMPNNGTWGKTLYVNESSVLVPKGYHGGQRRVDVASESVRVDPSTVEQTIQGTDTPNGRRFLKEVIINPAKIVTEMDITVTAYGYNDPDYIYLNCPENLPEKINGFVLYPKPSGSFRVNDTGYVSTDGLIAAYSHGDWGNPDNAVEISGVTFPEGNPAGSLIGYPFICSGELRSGNGGTDEGLAFIINKKLVLTSIHKKSDGTLYHLAIRYCFSLNNYHLVIW